MWKGGRIKRRGGYIALMRPDHPAATIQGYVREHRLVMEAVVGRYLTEYEVVHHVNGDPADNRMENLKLMKKAEHAKLHTEERHKAEPRFGVSS